MRKAGLDLCRILACLAVVTVHTVMLFWDIDPAAPAWAVWNCLTLVVRLGVPLFFVISGALLLGREKLDLRRHLRRTLHLILLYYAWSVICRGVDACCGRVWMDGTPLGLLILRGYYHLWFLPAMAMCYCAVPLLHGLAQGDEKNLRAGALLLAAIVTVLLTLEAVPDKPAWFQALLSPYRLDNYCYLSLFFLGRLLTLRPLSGRKLTWLGLAALASALLFSRLNRLAALRAGAPVEAYYGNITVSSVLLACFVFALCLRLEERAAKHAALLRTLSGCTLGVYLLHPVFIDLFRGQRLDLSAYSAVWLFPVCYLAFVFLPLGVTLVLKKLPFLRELVS